jgi:hypothetical protein
MIEKCESDNELKNGRNAKKGINKERERAGKNKNRFLVAMGFMFHQSEFDCGPVISVVPLLTGLLPFYQ